MSSELKTQFLNYMTLQRFSDHTKRSYVTGQAFYKHSKSNSIEGLSVQCCMVV
ncbi:MAG: hypothetical protein GY850_24330 [bacterium]|nr:hypothetical protein [bacterium]